MSIINITNTEFETLIRITKHFTDENIRIPSTGEKMQYRLIGENHKETLYLDINRSGIIELGKFTLQNRYITTPLVRLDINSAPHLNPDGGKVSRNHVHIYQEGYGDSWAYELDEIDNFISEGHHEFNDYLIDFCQYCNIILPQAQLSI